ncbi:MAG: ferrous iron transport protein A [Candidatus Omnitrophica bacterium]|nr:ferrous iron transport protein A [Candidatus Omnitrophota bacterium]
MMPLSMLGEGLMAEVVGLTGRPELKKFLADLGFIAGKNVEVIQHIFGNNIIVRIGSSRFALDRKMANCVEISPVKEAKCQCV